MVHLSGFPGLSQGVGLVDEKDDAAAYPSVFAPRVANSFMDLLERAGNQAGHLTHSPAPPRVETEGVQLNPHLGMRSDLVPERPREGGLAGADIARKDKQGWTGVEVVDRCQPPSVMPPVPVLYETRIDEEKGLLHEARFVLIQPNQSVILSLAPWVREHDDILEEVGMTQDAPPRMARRTPPPPEM